jgi:Golgi nucleoside diphosphatase
MLLLLFAVCGFGVIQGLWFLHRQHMQQILHLNYQLRTNKKNHTGKQLTNQFLIDRGAS